MLPHPRPQHLRIPRTPEHVMNRIVDREVEVSQHGFNGSRIGSREQCVSPSDGGVVDGQAQTVDD